jgi:hypothetical protein
MVPWHGGCGSKNSQHSRSQKKGVPRELIGDHAQMIHLQSPYWFRGTIDQEEMTKLASIVGACHGPYRSNYALAFSTLGLRYYSPWTRIATRACFLGNIAEETKFGAKFSTSHVVFKI